MRSLKHMRVLAAVLFTVGGLLTEAIQVAPHAHTALAAIRAQGTSFQVRFSDPFAYCSAVGTIDTPDSRYIGPPVPEVMAQALKKAFGASADVPLDVFITGTSWRCMGGKVYACNVGANLPCSEKADTSSTPLPGMINWCRENPNADVIPALASGRATVYEWRCTHGTPTIVRQVAQPDARGFLSHIWYTISPSP